MDDLAWLDDLPAEAQQALLEEAEQRLKRFKLWTYFPDEGPLRRELYKKHLEFFRLGATHRERCFMAANRVGKTESAGGYEMALHLTGRYPDWWEGRRFEHPVSAWTAGDTKTTVRDIQQIKLLGPHEARGTGLIPADDIVKIRPSSGVPDAVDSVTVRHVSGGVSSLGFKSYDQGRESFQGTEKHVIWLDEECPLSVYGECLIRTMTTQGLVMLTFTPLSGLTDTVLEFLPGGRAPDTADEPIIQAGSEPLVEAS